MLLESTLGFRVHAQKHLEMQAQLHFIFLQDNGERSLQHSGQLLNFHTVSLQFSIEPLLTASFYLEKTILHNAKNENGTLTYN